MTLEQMRYSDKENILRLAKAIHVSTKRKRNLSGEGQWILKGKHGHVSSFVDNGVGLVDTLRGYYVYLPVPDNQMEWALRKAKLKALSEGNMFAVNNEGLFHLMGLPDKELAEELRKVLGLKRGWSRDFK